MAEAGDNLDNMAWAIRAKGFYGPDGLHSKPAQDAALKLLKAAEEQGGSFIEIQSPLKESLKDMRDKLQNGRKFW